ncbi:sigma-w pathway protein ysdB [Caryophanon latum]|uniref:Sigma-w pathway protein ysdB n=1 Tax=Caryophanon latum TaxID=33977 RepID=A0A1C0Z0V1_9BACL|nr:sigma-w pathway protein ysdB [Caryophanon latum]OCS93049.1 sigma-w pathway protein ysdB [Caryophanon latum]
MIVLMIRFLLLLVIVYVIYVTLRYLFNNERKLKAAKEKGAFFFEDDAKNVRKNFLLTYKGALFEGEKYMDNVNGTFTVASIFIHATDEFQLDGFTKENFLWIEQQVHLHYPHATIYWNDTIEQLLRC